MALTKGGIIDSVHTQLNLPRHRSAELVESVLEFIKRDLEKGEDVLISGFGKFCVKEKSERRGRKPGIGEDLMLGAMRVVTFTCSPVLNDKLNGKR